MFLNIFNQIADFLSRSGLNMGHCKINHFEIYIYIMDSFTELEWLELVLSPVLICRINFFFSFFFFLLEVLIFYLSSTFSLVGGFFHREVKAFI